MSIIGTRLLNNGLGGFSKNFLRGSSKVFRKRSVELQKIGANRALLGRRRYCTRKDSKLVTGQSMSSKRTFFTKSPFSKDTVDMLSERFGKTLGPSADQLLLYKKLTWAVNTGSLSVIERFTEKEFKDAWECFIELHRNDSKTLQEAREFSKQWLKLLENNGLSLTKKIYIISFAFYFYNLTDIKVLHEDLLRIKKAENDVEMYFYFEALEAFVDPKNGNFPSSYNATSIRLNLFYKYDSILKYVPKGSKFSLAKSEVFQDFSKDAHKHRITIINPGLDVKSISNQHYFYGTGSSVTMKKNRLYTFNKDGERVAHWTDFVFKRIKGTFRDQCLVHNRAENALEVYFPGKYSKAGMKRVKLVSPFDDTVRVCPFSQHVLGISGYGMLSLFDQDLSSIRIIDYGDIFGGKKLNHRFVGLKDYGCTFSYGKILIIDQLGKYQLLEHDEMELEKSSYRKDNYIIGNCIYNLMNVPDKKMSKLLFFDAETKKSGSYRLPYIDNQYMNILDEEKLLISSSSKGIEIYDLNTERSIVRFEEHMMTPEFKVIEENIYFMSKEGELIVINKEDLSRTVIADNLLGSIFPTDDEEVVCLRG